MRQTYANVAEVLARFDATMDNIVDEMWLVTDMHDTMGKIEELFGMRVEAYGGNPDVTQTIFATSTNLVKSKYKKNPFCS